MTPEEVRLLIAEAERGKRPEMARAIATTALGRTEPCALRPSRGQIASGDVETLTWDEVLDQVAANRRSR